MAIHIHRVYTKTGDQGETGLVGGKRVAKDSPRIEAYGTVDELNSIVGLTRVFNQEVEADEVRVVDGYLKQIQNELFDLGSELATPPESFVEGMPRVGPEQVRRMEEIMDRYQKELQPLKSFVLPGGGRVSSLLHQCRTVCRRTERLVLRFSRSEEVGPWPLIYLNRLSDFFFVLSRWVAQRWGEEEFLWERGLKSPPASFRSGDRTLRSDLPAGRPHARPGRAGSSLSRKRKSSKPQK
jgi:cob(I)alamin adenosyltransferase